MEYRYGSHTVFNIEYHFVWVTKYRYHILQGDIAQRVRELVRQTCEAFEIRIISGVVSKDHVHIFVSAPPTMAPSEIMRRIKGRTASKFFEEFPVIKKRYWGRHFWGRAFFVSLLAKLRMK
jgi:putative transposase